MKVLLPAGEYDFDEITWADQPWLRVTEKGRPRSLVCMVALPAVRRIKITDVLDMVQVEVLHENQ